MGKRKTNNEFISEFSSIYGDEYTPLQEYVDSDTKILMRHNLCGHVWGVRPNSMTGKTKSGCPKCVAQMGSIKRSMSHEDFNRKIRSLYLNEYTLLSEYQRKRENIKIRHNVCGYEWETLAGNLTKKGVIIPCEKCRLEKSRLDKEQISHYIYEQVQDEYTLLDEYVGMQKKLAMRHNKCGHVWGVRMDNFLRNKSRCPNCSVEQSLPEKFIYYYLKKIYPDIKSNYKPSWLGKQEIDMFIPSIKIGIEYDGEFYHSSKDSYKRDIKKTKKIKENGIKLVRIREPKCHSMDNNRDDIIFNYKPDNKNYTNIDTVVEFIISLLPKGAVDNHRISIDTKRDLIDVLEECKIEKEQNNLDNMFPEIAEEWHPSKNGSLTPKNFSYGSDYDVWWMGKCGHEWQAQIKNRTLRESKCPVCCGLQLLEGYNDLYTRNPGLAKEWHPSKNSALKPGGVRATSDEKVWWLGECGHEWKSSVRSRNDGSGCHYCSGHKVLAGFNDLSTINPDLAKEWHPTMNGDLMPTEVTANNNKKVWWLGHCGHEWEAAISGRNTGNGCHYCSGHKVLSGFNDLSTINPRLAKEWHPTMNGALMPTEVTANNNKKVWWLGYCGHEWDAAISGRNTGSGCPYCCNSKILIGFNDLKTTHKDLIKEWDYSKNKNIKPTEVTKGNKKNVWWTCSNNHSFNASIYSRVKGTGCTECIREANDMKWKNKFEIMEKCFMIHGNSEIPTEMNVDGVLSKWAYAQRKNLKQGKLESWKINKLNSINFRWDL